MSHLLLVLLSLFSLAIPLEAKWRLRENVYVIESEWTQEAPAEEVELTCNLSEDQPMSVYWMKDKLKIGTDKTLVISVKEFPDAGNYTCHKSDTHEILSYYFFLITKKDSSRQISKWILKSFKEPNSMTFLKCEAKNYSGIFICSWKTENESPDVKFTIKNLEGTQEDASGSVICGSPVPQRYELETTYTVSCQKTNHCPFAEEHQPIEMFLEVIDETQYDNCTSSFFIRDIIKPDPPECVHVVKNGTVTWKYPRTWSTPESYFPLTFKVNAKERNPSKNKFYDTDEQFIHLATTSKLEKIYIQARDRYYNSSWSDWKLCR
ncbi:interleukin-12 subunit beta [Gopherus flavomarginatus]|uniref:interleukin-12 subunit beta n=1 Tax=Gopherus flavomarginatus TaxID=286002 RepID=UPI0021CBC4FE|nr:interleukin-12 subunit beta [Gopherus flavomarginatus]